MEHTDFRRIAAVAAFLLACHGTAGAQTFETVGVRALGMGGAFVAVADDATATWWNPAGLATGATLDIVLSGGTLETRRDPSTHPPAGRRTGTVFGLTTPALGLSYCRLRLTEVDDSGAIATNADSRQNEEVVPALRTLAVSQYGVTVLQTLVSGLHVGTTLKYLRAGAVAGPGMSGRAVDDLLSDGGKLDVDSDGAFDLDVGVMGSVGAIRAGATIKNVRQPEFEIPRTGGHAPVPSVRLDRQVRAGVAVDVAAAGGPPLILAVDADLRSVPTVFGLRRNLAVGAEQWLFARRLGVRAGTRVDTLGTRRPVGAAGASVAARSGVYVEGQVTRGGDRADRGWSLGGRVTF